MFTTIGHAPTLAVYKFTKEYTMGKSYHTKKKYRQRIDEIDQSRKKQSYESDITVLSTLNQMYNGYEKASESLSRHPSGTKASGKWRVALVNYTPFTFLDLTFNTLKSDTGREREQRPSVPPQQKAILQIPLTTTCKVGACKDNPPIRVSIVIRGK